MPTPTVVVHGLPPPHKQSLGWAFRWVKTRWTIAIQALFWQAIWTAVTVLLHVKGHYNWNMYTEWQWAYFHVYLFFVFIGELFGGWIQSLTALILDPLAINTSRMVAVIISLIIVTSPIVYINGTTCVGGDIDIGLVRLFDWILHGLPILAVFSLHSSGYNQEVKFQATLLVRALHWGWTLLFIGWMEFSTVITMVIYMLVENPIKQYHPSIKLWQLVLFGLILNVFLATTWLFDLLSDSAREVGTLPFYSRKKLLAWEAANTPNKRKVLFT